MPLWQEDRQEEDQGAYPEDQGCGDEEELGKAGGVMVVALGGQVLANIAIRSTLQAQDRRDLDRPTDVEWRY